MNRNAGVQVSPGPESRAGEGCRENLRTACTCSYESFQHMKVNQLHLPNNDMRRVDARRHQCGTEQRPRYNRCRLKLAHDFRKVSLEPSTVEVL
jgi:hypothetical protein